MKWDFQSTTFDQLRFLLHQETLKNPTLFRFCTYIKQIEYDQEQKSPDYK